MTGSLTMPSNLYQTNSKYGIYMNNSDIAGINSLVWGDRCDSAEEGIQFRYSDSTLTYDTIWDANGVLYYAPNHSYGAAGTNYTVYHSGNLTKLSQLTDDLGSAPAHTHSQYALKAGDTFTGTTNFNSDVHLNDETYADSATIGDLIVTGSARYTNTINGTITNAVDADTLDGYHATAFSLAGHTHNYAGSSSAGGNATKADSITTVAGTSDSYRNVFFAYAGDNSKVVYDNDFTYNPSSNTLKIGTGTLTATQYSGNAATSSSCSGNATTATTASKTQASLTFGNKTFNGSTAQTITAADLGLSSALKFIGTTTTQISDGSTTNPVTISGTSTTASTGDVVAYGAVEYL